MRVVDITGWFSTGAGGIKTYFRAKAQHLPPLGIDCHFVVPAAQNEERSFGEGTLHGIAGPPMPGDKSYRLMADLLRLRKLIRRLRPDVVELASHYVLPELVDWALPGAARVGFYHADVPRAYVGPMVEGLPAALRECAIDAAFAWVRRRHAGYRATLVASRTVEALLHRHAVPAVTWVGLGVDLGIFRPRPELRAQAPTVVYAGRLNREKAVRVLLDAWRRLPEHLGATLVVAGSGPLAGSLAGQPGVHFVGYIEDRAALAELFASAWAVVVPGAYETFSLTAAETMACATPIVTPHVGAAAELATVSGGGVTFRAHDSASLADALLPILELSDEARAAMGARGRAHVERGLSWPAVCRRIVDVYRAVA